MANEYSFLGTKANENKYKRSEMIPRGVSSDKLKRGKVGHKRRSVRDVININESITDGMLMRDDDISFSELPDEDSESTTNNILFEGAPRFSYDTNSGALIIRDRRGKAFRLVSDDNGNENLEFYEGDNAKILEKIKYVERLSKELIGKSVKKGIYPSDFCTAVNTLHEIGNSGVYSAENVRLAAIYTQAKLKEDFPIVLHGTHSYIVNIKNSLRELSEI